MGTRTRLSACAAERGGLSAGEHRMETPEPDIWEQADAILDRLLDLPAPGRPAELAAMRLPPALETCVRRLLDAHTSTGPLDCPPAAADDAPATNLAGRRIGSWTLEREL